MIRYPDPPLRDGGIALRPLEGRDSAELVELHRGEHWHGLDDPRWTGTAEDISIAEQRRLVDDAILMAIVDVDTESFRGAVVLRLVSGGLVGEIGIGITDRGTAQDFAAAATELVITWAFQALSLWKIQARVRPESQASIDFFQRLGFERESSPPAYRVIGTAGANPFIYSVRGDRWSQADRGVDGQER
jgi:RimJ/RimL family protein N-acetyltransferase